MFITSKILHGVPPEHHGAVAQVIRLCTNLKAVEMVSGISEELILVANSHPKFETLLVQSPSMGGHGLLADMPLQVGSPPYPSGLLRKCRILSMKYTDILGDNVDPEYSAVVHMGAQIGSLDIRALEDDLKFFEESPPINVQNLMIAVPRRRWDGPSIPFKDILWKVVRRHDSISSLIVRQQCGPPTPEDVSFNYLVDQLPLYSEEMIASLGPADEAEGGEDVLQFGTHQIRRFASNGSSWRDSWHFEMLSIALCFTEVAYGRLAKLALASPSVSQLRLQPISLNESVAVGMDDWVHSLYYSNIIFVQR